MADQSELIVIFNNLVFKRRPARLHDIYRGLPFNYDAEVRAGRRGSWGSEWPSCSHIQPALPFVAGVGVLLGFALVPAAAEEITGRNLEKNVKR